QTDRRLDQPTNAEKPRLRCQPARLKSSKRLVQPPFGLVLCDRSPTRPLTCVSWTGLRCLPERTPLGTPTATVRHSIGQDPHEEHGTARRHTLAANPKQQRQTK